MYMSASSTSVTVSEARGVLPEILDRVQSGEEITLTRHGRAVAVIVRPDTLRSRRADAIATVAANVRDLVAQGRKSALADQRSLSEERAEQLIAEVRAARSRR
jgi:prevent-host-death family protein